MMADALSFPYKSYRTELVGKETERNKIGVFIELVSSSCVH